MDEIGDISHDVPVIPDDPFTFTHLTEPHTFYEQLREAGPVFRLGNLNIWGMARYEQVHATLKDWEIFSSAAGIGLVDLRKHPPLTPGLLLEADPPLHTQTRSLLGPLLSPPALRDLKGMIAQEAESLVDRLTEMRSFEALSQLAEVYVLRVFGEALGLPEEGREALLTYVMQGLNALGPQNPLLEEGQQREALARQWVMQNCQREVLRPGSIGARIWAAVDTGALAEAWAPLLVRSLCRAGFYSTIHALVTALYALATYTEQWEQLRQNPDLARQAFEETVRWEAPIQRFFRTTMQPIEINDVHIPEGEKVLLFLGAANRDPRRWSEPDRFLITRQTSGHVGFGMGIHRCIGQPLARLEAEILLATIARRWKHLEITGQPLRKPNNVLYAWQCLPLTVYP